MFYVLVKFRSQPAPVLFGTSHVSHASKLASMADVEWVSPTIANGTAIAHATAFGGAFKQAVTGPRIEGYSDEISKGDEGD